jgi:hypothetical protein
VPIDWPNDEDCGYEFIVILSGEYVRFRCPERALKDCAEKLCKAMADSAGGKEGYMMGFNPKDPNGDRIDRQMCAAVFRSDRVDGYYIRVLEIAGEEWKKGNVDAD